MEIFNFLFIVAEIILIIICLAGATKIGYQFFRESRQKKVRYDHYRNED